MLPDGGYNSYGGGGGGGFVAGDMNSPSGGRVSSVEGVEFL